MQELCSRPSSCTSHMVCKNLLFPFSIFFFCHLSIFDERGEQEVHPSMLLALCFNISWRCAVIPAKNIHAHASSRCTRGWHRCCRCQRRMLIELVCGSVSLTASALRLTEIIVPGGEFIMLLHDNRDPKQALKTGKEESLRPVRWIMRRSDSMFSFI